MNRSVINDQQFQIQKFQTLKPLVSRWNSPLLRRLDRLKRRKPVPSLELLHDDSDENDHAHNHGGGEFSLKREGILVAVVIALFVLYSKRLGSGLLIVTVTDSWKYFR